MSVNCVCELFVCVARYGPECASDCHGPAVGVSRSVLGVSLAAVSAGETIMCVTLDAWPLCPVAQSRRLG